MLVNISSFALSKIIGGAPQNIVLSIVSLSLTIVTFKVLFLISSLTPESLKGENPARLFMNFGYPSVVCWQLPLQGAGGCGG